MERLELPGRILYLAASEEAIRAQLAGRRLARAEAGALRDDVSTDEITPVPILTHYDDKLGRYPYTGFKVGGARPIGVDAIRAGGFSVTVAGKRYGKGSSREHSPAAERLAGIRLVDRRELRAHLPPERRQHRPLHLDRLRPRSSASKRARRSPSTSCVAGRDALAAAILKSGGLLRFGQRCDARRAAGAGGAARGDAAHAVREDRRPPCARRPSSRRPHPQPGEGAFVRADWRFIHEYYTGMCAHMLTRPSARRCALHEPAPHRRVRGPHLVRRREPGARARRPGAERAAMCRGAARRSSRATACARIAR